MSATIDDLLRRVDTGQREFIVHVSRQYRYVVDTEAPSSDGRRAEAADQADPLPPRAAAP